MNHGHSLRRTDFHHVPFTFTRTAYRYGDLVHAETVTAYTTSLAFGELLVRRWDDQGQHPSPITGMSYRYLFH